MLTNTKCDMNLEFEWKGAIRKCYSAPARRQGQEGPDFARQKPSVHPHFYSINKEDINKVCCGSTGPVLGIVGIYEANPQI